MSSTAKRRRTILIYGRSRAGKSSLASELAISQFEKTGLKTRVYTLDKGGYDPYIPAIEMGVVDLVEQGESDPWIFLNSASKGLVRDEAGKWVKDPNPVGMYVFESMTSFADALMASMVKKAGEGVSIGGGGNISFVVQGDGESLKVGGSNMAMFGVCQSQITDKVWASQTLDAPFILWTASASKDDDQNAAGKVIGPAVIGKALTAEVPRWFNLCFRLDCLPAQSGKAERHILYLGNSVDVNAANAVGLGNTRIPLGAKELPSQLEPASLVKALELIDGAHKEALETLRKRLAGMAALPPKAAS